MEKLCIPVVFATDAQYVPFCGVAVSSLIANANPENVYRIYILYDTLPPTAVYRLEHLSTDYAQVRCLCVHAQIETLRAWEYNHLTIASAYRLVIPDVLPQYEKLLYLDSDMIIQGDVAELFAMDLGDNILGAVGGYYKSDNDHFMYRHITQNLKIRPEDFFNAGVLSFNLKAFQEQGVKDKCFTLLGSRTDLYFMDQCALNIVCTGKVKFLPLEWNFEWQFLFSQSAPTEKDRQMENALYGQTLKIIHYDGVEKPWDYPDQRLAEVFWFYARKTIFYEEILLTAHQKRTREILDVLGVGTGFRNVAIYGAGNAGKRYVNRVLSLKLCRIAVWVDRDYANKQDCFLPVSPVEQLYETNFDHVVIAIENSKISGEVKQMLIEHGIPPEKILQIK